MERERQKRVREGDEEQYMNICPEKHAKTNDDPIKGGSNISSRNSSSSCKTSSSSSLSLSSSSSSSSSQYLALGVFDFPWLKDGTISKLSEEEDWNFEDVFSSSVVPFAVVDDTTCTGGSSSSSSSGQCFYESSDPHHQDQKLEEDLWRRPLVHQHHDHALELDTTDEGVDCIWSSLFNQPLHQPN